MVVFGKESKEFANQFHINLVVNQLIISVLANFIAIIFLWEMTNFRKSLEININVKAILTQ